MAKKIILYLSDRAEGEENTYLCPDGSKVTGIRTNEAPVKYLLHKNRTISQVICVLTPTARKQAWEPVQAYLKEECPDLVFEAVDLKPGEDFAKEPLKKILALVEPGDEIFLETSGGLRNTVMDLLLLSRVLGYTGIRVSGAVYSNFQEKRVEDISYLFQRFTLVDGLQELTGFGSVRALREYYKNRPQDNALQQLINAMEKLSDEILMCRTRNIDRDMERFNSALDRAEQTADPMLAALLPAFRDKFKGYLTIPNLILWCVDSNMIQQALTIYKERAPAYILDSANGIAQLKKNHTIPEKFPDYADEMDVQFQTSLTEMAERASSRAYWLRQNWRADNTWDNRVAMLEDFEHLLAQSDFEVLCSTDRFRNIVMDYFYIRILRNMVNHANEKSAESEQLEQYLNEIHRRKRPDQVKVEDIKTILRQSAKRLAPELGQKG